MTIKEIKYFRLLIGLMVVMLAITACGKTSPALPTLTPEPVEPTPTTTAVPQKTLVICLSQEPESLYLYANSSRAMWNVLEAIYDGPIDTVNYLATPVILEVLPALDNGGVTINAVPVTAGDQVANVEGDVVALAKGVKVFPEGCTSPECAVTWDGLSPISLSQMTARFKLMDGIKWSDGAPLIAQDSVFSYSVSLDPTTDVVKTNLNRTLSYTAEGENTIVWTGIPGYLTLNPAAFFWLPMPSHLLASISPQEMYTAELTAKAPLGWGAYQVDEWVDGDHIRLVKNPNYYRAAEGLPAFDVVVYRFLNDYPETDISQVVTGECDIIDSSAGLEGQITAIRELENSGQAKGYFTPGPEWEALNFGVAPASYDDVYNPWLDRQNFFGDLRVRQAFAYCIDREQISKKVLYSQSAVPGTNLPPGHPYAAEGLTAYQYAPDLGMKLLDEAGWLDPDGDPATPRVATGIGDVMEDTEFIINYYLTKSDLHEKVSNIVIESLGQCGIKVNRTYLDVTEMFKTGEGTLVFGRNFDLAELAWSTGRQSPCFLFSSSEIPTAANNWLGTKYGGVNFSGFSNESYDLACTDVLATGLNGDLLTSRSRETQQILADELPMLPLFYHVKVMISRPDLCGLSLDVSSRSPFRQLELLDISSSCPAD